MSSATPTVHFSENVLATSGKLEASSCVFYQIISCSDLPAGYQMAHTSATPVHISSFAYSTSDVVSHTHTSVTPARISSSAYSTSDIVSYAQTSANPAHVSSSAPQRHDFVATDLIFRLLVFSLLAAPRDAKAIRLEEEPEIVQTLFHWSGEFILMWAVLTFFNLIVAIMGWPQAQRNGREADQEGGQSREVKEGSGTAGMEEENIESGPAEDCLNDGPQGTLRDSSKDKINKITGRGMTVDCFAPKCQKSLFDGVPLSTHTTDNFLKFINWGWILFNAFELFRSING